MELPPITKQEVELEWQKLRRLAPQVKRYVAGNMVLIRKCFGDGAYAAALQQLAAEETK